MPFYKEGGELLADESAQPQLADASTDDVLMTGHRMRVLMAQATRSDAYLTFRQRPRLLVLSATQAKKSSKKERKPKRRR